MRGVNDVGNFFEMEELSAKDRYNEYVLTRLRTIWGCDINEMDQLFGEAALAHFKRMVQEIKEYVIEKNGSITLTTAGKLRADGLASSLFL